MDYLYIIFLLNEHCKIIKKKIFCIIFNINISLKCLVIIDFFNFFYLRIRINLQERITSALDYLWNYFREILQCFSIKHRFRGINQDGKKGRESYMAVEFSTSEMVLRIVARKEGGARIFGGRRVAYLVYSSHVLHLWENLV